MFCSSRTLLERSSRALPFAPRFSTSAFVPVTVAASPLRGMTRPFCAVVTTTRQLATVGPTPSATAAAVAAALPPHMDGHTGASVVIVDPEAAARERDRLAREMLRSNFPLPKTHERFNTQLLGVAHTVPYALTIVAVRDNEPMADSNTQLEAENAKDTATNSAADATATAASEGDASTKSNEGQTTSAIPTRDQRTRVAAVAERILAEQFAMVDAVLNHFNPDSEVSKVNRLPVGETHTMSPALRAVMTCCQEVYRASGSTFDPATLPLVRRLRAAASKPRSALTDDDKVSAADAELYSLANSFDIDLSAGTIARRHAGAELDLGALNKGYTVDCVVEALNAAGYDDVLFEWGGDCRASGRNVRGEHWVVGIRKPPTVAECVARARAGPVGHVPVVDSGATVGSKGETGAGASLNASPTNNGGSTTKTSEADLLRVVTLNNESLCTSGDYENLVYSDAIDGVVTSIYQWESRRLLRPSNDHVALLSVVAYSCMYADALATAGVVKRDIPRVRYLMEAFRYDSNRVTNYAAYIRDGECLAHMYEIAKESATQREKRIAGSLPARVVVVGGGLAGHAAAIEAADCGAQVVLIEKEGKLGGNSAKATSGINGWGTRTQAMYKVSDSCHLFERDTYLSGVGGNCNPGLVRTLSVKSAEAINWLTKFGVPLTVLYQLGGASRKRCHRAPDQKDGTPVPVGFTIMRVLEEHVRTKLKDKVTILNDTSVVDLVHQTRTMPDGNREVRVTGVKILNHKTPEAPPLSLAADAVVLATGGFSNDHTTSSLLRQYAPQLCDIPTTNGTFATGDGVKMAHKLGASLVDMDKVQLHPTGFIDPKDPANRTKFLGPEALRGSGGILLNKAGERFVNELDLRSVVSAAIIAQDDVYPGTSSRFAHCVLSEAAVQLFGVNSLRYYWKKQGLFRKVETVTELAELIGCDEGTLTQTLRDYEELASTRTACPSTGKMVYPSVVGTKGPYYVACITPSIHYTMGGCVIDSSAEVLAEHHGMNIFEDKRPILGLFGAGEVTGGVHGGNRLGGNSLLECVVFGKIAGDRAATILQRTETALRTDEWTPVVVRESRAGDQFGVGSRVLRFNLPGALQVTGLTVGQFIGIRGEWDGQQLVGYYSPITLPDEKGFISILARGDRGKLQEWISNMRPGDAVEMKSCGGLQIVANPAKKQLLYKKMVIRKLALIAGGTGVAPMLQIIRAALARPYVDHIESVRLLYAANEAGELTYRQLLTNFAQESPDKLQVGFVLSNPPEGWTGGVGYVDRDSLQRNLQPPSSDLLVAICGPPAMQRSVKQDLLALGYNPAHVRTIDEDMIL